jgi:putative transposase
MPFGPFGPFGTEPFIDRRDGQGYSSVMPRAARIVLPEQPHHVTQRGNRRADVFFADADRLRYLELLHDYGEQHRLEILGWCLMSNHIHLVLVPPDEAALGLVLRTVHMRYTQWVNRRQGWTGHLWQSRFFSCVLGEAHCWSAMRYVEQNPVRAGLVTAAEDYLWSSAAGHCGLRADPLASGRWTEGLTPQAWLAELRTPLDEETVARVRSRTMSGLPCGDESFLARVSALVGRELVARGRGRPPKDGGAQQ